MKTLLTTLIVVLALRGAHGQTIRIHVAPPGTVRSGGAEPQSFSSLRAALEEVQRRAPQAKGDVAVVVHAGVYRIEEPIVVGVEHVPPAGRLRIEAAEGATPVVSGGRAVSGWKARADGAFVTTLPQVKANVWKFRELFVSGRRRPRARHPNAGWARVVDAFPDRRSGFTFAPGAVPEGAGVPGIELLFLHDWSSSRIPVASLDHGKRSLTAAHPIGPKAPHYRIDHFEKHARFRIENDPALLDAPGEWYLDVQTGILAYRPMSGETVDTIEAVAPIARSLLEVRGTTDKPVQRVTVRGITFAHCAWPLPPGGFAAGQATFHEDRASGEGNEIRRRVPAAVSFERAVGCVFERCRVGHVGTSGIAFGASTTDCALVGCVIEDVGGNGVILGEDTARHVGGRAWWKVAPGEAACRLQVSNNVVQRCGQLFPGSVGIWVGIANHVTVSHNLVQHHPYTGISVGWRWNAEPTPCHHNTIAHNHIHHVMQVLSDGGGIYALGRQPGTTLHRNYIHDVPINAGRAGSNGMFLDQGVADVVVSDNVIHGIEKSPLRFHLVVGVEVKDNVLVTKASAPAYRYNATKPEVVIRRDNTVISEDSLDLQAPAVAAVIAAAGLEPSYREPSTEPQEAADDFFSVALAGKGADLGSPAADIGEFDALRRKLHTSYAAAVRQAGAGEFKAPVAIGGGKGTERVQLEPASFHIGEGLDMPYVVFSRGKKPEGGWPLVIAMHGGGGTSKKLSGPHGWRVNTREWQVQASFAATRYPDGAIYFVPRMVDDNNGRWWRDFNVEAYEAMIRHGIVHWDVDPDRVYMLGISEGGYGTEVLSTRLSDRLAAVSAMACGSGSSIHVENLRNLPFRTDVGERDTAFGRVSNARKNHETLERLRGQDPEGYVNLLNVQKGRGHGIDYTPGPVWMFKHQRRAHPERVVLTTYRADKKRNDSAYWLQVTKALGQRDLYLDAKIDVKTNTIDITAEATRGDAKYQSPDWQQALADGGHLVPASGLELRVWLHESLIDFSKPVTLRVNGKDVLRKAAAPSLKAMAESLQRHGDPRRIFPASLDFRVN